MTHVSLPSSIHPTAIIDPKAQLASDVEVGPYCVIGAGVQIDSGSVIGPHVVIQGPTHIGKGNRFFQFSSIGEACQDKKYKGEPTRLVMGDNNIVREFVTLQRGTVQDRSETTIGNHNLFMAYVHIAHDCVIGNHTIFANNATIAGHVIVQDHAILGGFTAVHQFCQIGSYSMSGMCTAINKDVPAFVLVQGNMAKARGMNFENMRRRGLDPKLIMQLRTAYKIVYKQGISLEQAILKLKQLEPRSAELQLFISTLQSSQRGIVR